jgi:cytochrome P450
MAAVASPPDLGAALIRTEGIADPYPIYSVLRETEPVYWSEALRAWLVTRYEHVREVYRDPSRFSNLDVNNGNLLALPPEVQAQVPTVVFTELTPSLNTADPPLHTAHRRQIMRSLAPRRLYAKQEWLTQLSHQLADELEAQSEPDLIEHFTTQLSYHSILGLFGAPTDLIPLYDEVTQAFAQANRVTGATVEDVLHYERTLVDFREVLESTYERLQDSDEETIIGSLLNPPEDTDRLTPEEMFSILKIFFAAGHQNLIQTVATTTMFLLRDPEQHELVRQDLDLIADAYEEGIRFETPHQTNRRRAKVDSELGGKTLRAGDLILNVKGSASRDPAVWTRPDAFDLTRDQNEPPGGSIIFGQGIHFCAGAGLARLEGPIALRVLFERFPKMRLHEDWQPRWRNQPLNRHLVDMPLILR